MVLEMRSQSKTCYCVAGQSAIESMKGGGETQHASDDDEARNVQVPNELGTENMVSANGLDVTQNAVSDSVTDEDRSVQVQNELEAKSIVPHNLQCDDLENVREVASVSEPEGTSSNNAESATIERRVDVETGHNEHGKIKCYCKRVRILTNSS